MIRPDRKTEPKAPLSVRKLSDTSSATPQKAKRDKKSPQQTPVPPGYRPGLFSSSKPIKKPVKSPERNPADKSEYVAAREVLFDPKPARKDKQKTGRSTQTRDNEGPRRPGHKAPRKMTAKRVRNIAEHYVASRECSEGMLRECLDRRLKKRLFFLSPEEAEAEALEARDIIDAEVARLVQANLVNDSRFAEMKARAGLSCGRGVRRIMIDLTQKGVSKEVAQDAIREASREMTGTLGREDVDDDEVARSAEWEAAETFARKKRFGPYRSTPLPEDYTAAQKIWRREASSMARRGFGIDLIRQILDREPEDDAF